ncbi:MULTISPECIES: hypothetical protein [Arthrobacter]|uniref:GH26 domain-containing protein n=2 Tax=Arthrobacter TaxID=1663 RepID=A0ABU9KP31_9MICC|nr:hypothetical protein [Arthrobacter sp. YJM1]MDP5228461.1 hypothetical protein [Arthrobacter sp. YJM1]
MRTTTRRALSAAAVALAGVLSSCSAGSPGPTASASCGVPARTEGTGSGVSYGVNLDWGHQQLADYAQALGHHPAVAVSFSGFPFTDTDRTNVHGAADQVRRQGATLLLTLEPHRGLAAASDPGVLKDLTDLLTEINRSGVGVIVRFGQEMNGSWYEWGEQPTAYVAVFRKVAAAVHAAPSSTTMWAPNYGGGYPFAGGKYQTRKGTGDFAVLDTNHDGAVDGRDDPYAPYYPGDAAVDWVGMSLYHWGNAYPWGANVVPEPGKFVQQLTGTYNGAGGNDLAVPDFYAEYGVGRKKPVAIAETAALLNTSQGAGDALAIKRAWWGQIFSADVRAKFPALKMVNWFEWDKYETEVKAQVDWTAIKDPAVRAAFTAALPSWLSYGSGQSCSQG